MSALDNRLLRYKDLTQACPAATPMDHSVLSAGGEEGSAAVAFDNLAGRKTSFSCSIAFVFLTIWRILFSTIRCCRSNATAVAAVFCVSFCTFCYHLFQVLQALFNCFYTADYFPNTTLNLAV